MRFFFELFERRMDAFPVQTEQKTRPQIDLANNEMDSYQIEVLNKYTGSAVIGNVQ